MSPTPPLGTPPSPAPLPPEELPGGRAARAEPPGDHIGMLAAVPVRAGQLPRGGAEAVAEAGGRVLLVGDDVMAAAAALTGVASRVQAWEAGAYAPAAWASALATWAPVRAATVVVLPASPDGRDLAPRLAHALGRELFAGAVRVGPDGVEVARSGGLVVESHTPAGPFVATLQPGARGVPPVGAGAPPPPVERIDPPLCAGAADAVVVTVLPPDPATVDLSEARRIVAGGVGLGGADHFALLAQVAPALGASPGATRPIADAGWVPFERQIGTTGTVVDPDVYVALGISGAVQHVSGLGDPRLVIAVNLDSSCPMMEMADVAIVADAPAVLDALAARLGLVIGADHA